jgi:cyclic beta-1,2-glucan synthetase
MQRAGIESIPGLQLEGDILRLDPCIPKIWPHYEMMVRFRSARYEILVENPDGVCRGIVAATMDGITILQQPFRLRMQDDGLTHRVVVRLG